jgi:hypothetical protein
LFHFGTTPSNKEILTTESLQISTMALILYSLGQTTHLKITKMKTFENLLIEIYNAIVENVQIVIITPKVELNPQAIPVRKTPKIRKQ